MKTVTKIKNYKDKVNLDKRYRQGLKNGLIVVVSLIVLFLITFATYSISYDKKSYARIQIGDEQVGGKSRSEINELLARASEPLLNTTIKLIYSPDEGEAKEYTIDPAEIGLSYDISKSADNVMAIGRSGGILKELWQQLASMFSKQNAEMSFSINEEALTNNIAAIAKEVDNPEKDFSLKYAGSGVFELTTERVEGKRIKQEEIVQNIRKDISQLENEEINFRSVLYKPQVDEDKAKETLALANAILEKGDLEVIATDKRFVLSVDTIASFLKSETQKNDLKIVIDEKNLIKKIEDLAGEIDTEAQNAVFKVDGGKVVAFGQSSEGKKLDREKAKEDISNAMLNRNQKKNPNVESITLVVLTTKPEVNSAEIEKYGLKELVASGTTSFSGSPANRIHNIKIGLNSINGTLLKPGEEFSTLGKLGKIDGSTGYLPELVIKNKKTVPEYGGGLCQVSTTLFRSALSAGMNITERYNHAYRVSYYEPPIGMDATIYDPAPDFKFINNYNSYILIQGKITGSKITFEFYGTKDSRVTEIGTPEAYEFVNPPAPEETPSDTLPLGSRTQLAKSHQGARAKFHYKVSRDGEILQEKDFLSKYVALAEKWLVGTAPVAAPVPAPATNTEDPGLSPAPPAETPPATP